VVSFEARRLALNRRLSAIHEAGHVVTAHSYDVESFGIIWPDGDCWDGCAIMPGVWDLPAARRRVVGIAGCAANMMWLGIPVDQFFTMPIQPVSDTDWKLIGRVAGRDNMTVLSEALALAIAKLERDWTNLLAVTRQIIAESRSPNPEILRLAKEGLSAARL
jgi:hypothetical protein